MFKVTLLSKKSSVKYKIFKEGKAIKDKRTAGTAVQNSSKSWLSLKKRFCFSLQTKLTIKIKIEKVIPVNTKKVWS